MTRFLSASSWWLGLLLSSIRTGQTLHCWDAQADV